MPAKKSGIHIVVIGGSVRPNNYTGRALRIVVDELERTDGVTVDVIDPATVALPLPGLDDDAAGGDALRARVAAATGIVLSTPEYHGSYSSVIKLVIDNLGFPSVLGGKPIALLGVAAGQIGAIKALEHLRSVLSHVGAIVLPGPTSVAGVQQVFDDEGRCLDEAVERRIRRTATSLLDYLHRHVCPSIALEAMVRGRDAETPA